MFRLRKVLEWKESLEKEAHLDRLAVELRARELEGRITRLTAARHSVPDAAPKGLDAVAELAAWSHWGEGLRGREEGARTELDGLRPELESRVRAHRELRAEVKGLRELDRRSREGRRRAVERKAGEALDEAGARTKLPEIGIDCRVPSRRAGSVRRAPGDADRAGRTRERGRSGRR